MIPYYNPNFGLLDLIKTLLCTKAEEKLTRNFQKATGKRYILITSSCRAALYLAYKAIEKEGVVHTSPLTCKVAILPILGSGNKVRFHDIKRDDWTLDPNSIEAGLRHDSIAIQAIHLGGFPCDMPTLRKIADENNLVLIEDCAQGYGASYAGVPTGRLGDISCFTLTKNLFGLGGGVFATNNKEWYEAAKHEQASFPTESIVKIAYRTVMAMLGTYRDLGFVEKLYQLLKGKPKQINDDDIELLKKELKQPARLYLKSCAARWGKITDLMESRKADAMELLKNLELESDKVQNNPLSEPSYTKLFMLSKGISPSIIQKLNASGIEAMHLEHKHKVYYQEPYWDKNDLIVTHGALNNTQSLYGHVLSIPIHAALSRLNIIEETNGDQKMSTNKKTVFLTVPHLADFNLVKNAAEILANRSDIRVVALVLKRGKLYQVAQKELNKGVIILPLSSWKKSFFGKIYSSIYASTKAIAYVMKYKPQVSIGPGNFTTDIVCKMFGIPTLQFSDDLELWFTMLLENMAATEKYVPAKGKMLSKMQVKAYSKQWAYLSKKYFSPSKRVLDEYNLKEKGYIFVREVTTKSANYRNQKEFLIRTISKSFPKDYQVVMSLEDKSVRHLYPENWIVLQEPVSDINSLMYYSAALVSSGDSVAREGAVLGVPSLYCGIRDMLVNQELIKLGALKKVDVNSVPEELEKIAMMPEPIAHQETMRNKVNDIYIEITDFMVERVLHYLK